MKYNRPHSKRRIHRSIAGAISAIILASCHTVQTADPALISDLSPQIWSDYAQRLKDAETASQPAYWQRHDEPELRALIQSTLENSNDLEVARLRVLEARSGRGIALSAYGLQLDADLTVQRQRLSETGGLPAEVVPGLETDRNLYEGGFDASWEFDLFGRRSVENTIEAAKIRSAEMSLESLQASLVAEVSRTFVECRTAATELVLLDRMIETQTELLGLDQQRADLGEGDQILVQESRRELNELKGEISVLQIAQQDALLRLDVLTGGTDDLPKCDASLNRIFGGELPQISSEALLMRPDVRGAEQDMIAQTAQLNLAQLEIYPRFQLFAGIGPNTTEIADFFDPASLTGEIGGLMDWSLLSGGRRAATQEREETRLKIAKTEYAQTVLLAVEEVEQAAVRYVIHHSEVERLTDLITLRRGELDLRLQRSELGEIRRDEALQADLALARVERSYAVATRDAIIAKISLDKALGTPVSNVAH